MERDILSKIFEANYTIVNHDMVKKFGLVQAYWLCEIISWMKHLRRKKRVDENEWFFYTQKHIEKKIGLSTQIQNRVTKKFASLGIIEVERRGLPAKNYFRLNYEILVQVLYGEDPSSINLIGNYPLNQEHYYNSKENSSTVNPPKDGVDGLPSSPNPSKRARNSKCVIKRKKGIPSDFYKLATKVQEKQIEKYPSRYKQYPPKKLIKQVENGAEVLHQLVKLDKWDFEQAIKPAIEWGLDDTFWTDKLMSLARLRTKSQKNGESKFTNLFDGWQSSKRHKVEAAQREEENRRKAEQRRKQWDRERDWKAKPRGTFKRDKNGVMQPVSYYEYYNGEEA